MQTQAWLHETILVVHEHASLMCIRQVPPNWFSQTSLFALTKQRTSFHVSFFVTGCIENLFIVAC